MKTAQLNGVELEYELSGSGEPLLLISPVLADWWLPLVSEPALADRYRLITYHGRGRVGSTHTPPPATIADHAADAAALLDHLDVPRAHVAGYPSGAAVALQLALAHRQLVHTLCLLELTLFSVPGAAALLQKAGPALEAYAAGDHDAPVTLFHERRQRPRLGSMPGRTRRPPPRYRGAGRQGRRHVLRRRAARPHRMGLRPRPSSRHPAAGAVLAGC
jgi:pimeloyl-ACP methyl ester carboxylesterase